MELLVLRFWLLYPVVFFSVIKSVFAIFKSPTVIVEDGKVLMKFIRVTTFTWGLV